MSEDTHIVTFEAGRNSGVMTRIEGKVSFPDRRGHQPAVGETWEVRIKGQNNSGTVNFLELIRQPPPATILVVECPKGYYKDRITVDGTAATDLGESVVEGRSVSLSLPSKGSMRRHSSSTCNLTPGAVYVLIYASYNARTVVSVPQLVNLREVFAYGDDHGRSWGALYQVVDPTDEGGWVIDWDVPGHHGHTTDRYRAVGDAESFERLDSER